MGLVAISVSVGGFMCCCCGRKHLDTNVEAELSRDFKGLWCPDALHRYGFTRLSTQQFRKSISRESVSFRKHFHHTYTIISSIQPLAKRIM